MTALAKLAGREERAPQKHPGQALARPGTPAPELRHLTAEQQARFDERLKLIEPMRAFAAGHLAALRFVDGREVRNLEDVAEWVAQRQGISKAKVRFWYYAFLRGGVEALEPKQDPRRGISRTFSRRPKLSAMVMAKLKEGLNIAHIADVVEREYGGALLPYQGEPPSYSAIRAFILSLPAALRDYPRMTQRKWSAKHAPYLQTGRGHYTRPNEVWVADHRIYDVLVANDCFADAPEGAALRLWNTCIQDMRTRVIVGLVWSVNPSSRTIARALRQGMSRFGKPEIFYCDNGKDFQKVGAGARRKSLLLNAKVAPAEQGAEVPRGLLARLGIHVSYCTPYHPQAKQVESYFNFVSQRFDPSFSRNGYTGRRPELRPDFCREQEKQHKEFLAGKRRESPLYPASKFMELHCGFVEEFNREHQHTGDGMMDGRTPMEVMDELLPAAKRIIPDMSELAPFFWDAELRKVTNCKVQLNTASYSAALDDPEGAREMFLANGNTVAVHFDPEDPAYAVAFENAPGGRRLALLFSDEIAAQQRMSAETVQAMCAQRAKLRKACREAWELGVGGGVPSEIERLAERQGIERPEFYSRPAARPALPAIKTFACDVSDEDAALLDQVEVNE